MNNSDFDKLVELCCVGGGWTPANGNAEELLDSMTRGEIVAVREVTQRDLKFHRAYFSLLNFIYDYLPPAFKRKVPKQHFYKFVKHLQGEYDVLFEFKDGTKLVEYQSISFGRMSQKRFEAYIREQLPWIYENIIGAFFEGEIYKNIIETIEMEYERFLQKL